QGAHIEIAVVGHQWVDIAAVHQIDLDGYFEQPPRRQHLQLKVQTLTAPDGALAAEPDLTVGIVVERLCPLGSLCADRLEITSGQLAGLLVNEFVAEGGGGLGLTTRVYFAQNNARGRRERRYLQRAVAPARHAMDLPSRKATDESAAL